MAGTGQSLCKYLPGFRDGALAMRLLLIVPKTYSWRYPGNIYPHTGVAYLAGFLKRNGIEVKILDMRLKSHSKRLLSTLDLFRPQLTGITLFSCGYARVYDLVHRIKNYGDYQVVLGGPHISAVRDSALRKSEADFAIKGEGEETLLHLCKTIGEAKSGYSNIQGLIWRSESRLVENDDRPFIDDLDALPFPAYEQFPLEKYRCYQDKVLPIITSRGCPWQCVFCSVRLCMGGKFRPRSPENVLAEIEHWHKQGWRNFEIQDDNFTCDIDRAMKICDLIISKDLAIKWSLPNGVRIDRLNRELLEKMRKSGCFRIALGVESANNEVLRKIRKRIKIEQIEEAVKIIKKAGMEVVGFFIVGHPTETYKRFMETVEFAKRMPFDQVNFWNMIPYPGTELLEWIKNNATLLYPEEVYLNRDSRCDGRPIFETADFSAEERRKAFRVGHSMERESIAYGKMGRFWGRVGLAISSLPILERIMVRLIKTNRIGRFLYKVLSSRTGKNRTGILVK